MAGVCSIRVWFDSILLDLSVIYLELSTNYFHHKSFEVSLFFSESLHHSVWNIWSLVLADDNPADIRWYTAVQWKNDHGRSIVGRFVAFGWRNIFKRCIWIRGQSFREKNITVFDWHTNDCELDNHMVCSNGLLTWFALFICIQSK